MTKKVAFLGVGNMGGALIEGALNSGVLDPADVTLYDIDIEKVNILARKHGITVAPSNRVAIDGAEYIFLCVKPQQIEPLLAEIKGAVQKGQCLVSIAAGIPIAKIEKNFSGRVPVIRVMPNTPALIRSGVSALAKGRHASRVHLMFATDFFSAVGTVCVLPEKLFDAVTAVSGSGPAYLFYLAECLQEAAERLGLPKKVAEVLSKQTLLGSGKMLMNASTPGELRRKVTSPGGTTEQAMKYLQQHQWSEVFIQAVEQARNKSRELSH